jgi:hypothetical protein
MGMITVVTDAVRENNQTYRLGWTEQCKDGYMAECPWIEHVRDYWRRKWYGK